jgi:signal transduction histidine kinase
VRSPWPEPDRRTLVAAAVAGAAASAVTAVVTATSSATGQPVLEATARALIVAIPIGVGLFAWSRPPSARFGRSLVLIGFGWFVGSLSASDAPALHSAGRVTGWFVEAAIVYLVLSFPSGWLTGRLDRGLVATAVVLALVLYLPTAFLVDDYPSPSQWNACSPDCPGNVFQLTATEPAFVEAWLRPLREVLTGLLVVAVTVRLAQRMTGASPLMRRALTPVLTVACARLIVFVVTLVVRAVAPESAFAAGAAWALALALPVLALAFLAGLLRWRLFVGSALQRLAGRRVTGASAGDLRGALADAFGDPGVRILYWVPAGGGRWIDPDGHSVEPPAPGSPQVLTEIRDGRRRVAGLVHDAALQDEHAFLDAGTAYALLTLENERLSARTAALLEELDQSRARIAATADEERRRIERDLHDGAQQRLVALRIRLGMAAELLAEDPARGAEMVRQLGPEAEAALDEVRSLARGVYPAPLADRGLPEALRAAGLRSPIPVVVVAEAGRRYPRPIESAVYFCCLEAMQNAAKHAAGATRIAVTVGDGDGDLRFEVADDGRGFDPQAVRHGDGLLNIEDRVRAAGGEVAVRSAPGEGTRVVATIPLAARTAGRAPH